MMICKLEKPICDIIFGECLIKILINMHQCWIIFIQFSLQPRTERRAVSAVGRGRRTERVGLGAHNKPESDKAAFRAQTLAKKPIFCQLFTIFSGEL